MLIEILIVSIIGTLLHFIYDWSGGNALVGLFGAVNESIWEHLKLLFWPLLFISLYEHYLIYKKQDGFLMARLVSVIIGMVFIVTLYYTVTGVIGKNIDAFNITLYFVSVILTFFISKLLIKNGLFQSPKSNAIALFIFAILAAFFIAFTKYPPRLGIFSEP